VSDFRFRLTSYDAAISRWGCFHPRPLHPQKLDLKLLSCLSEVGAITFYFSYLPGITVKLFFLSSPPLNPPYKVSKVSVCLCQLPLLSILELKYVQKVLVSLAGGSWKTFIYAALGHNKLQGIRGLDNRGFLSGGWR